MIKADIQYISSFVGGGVEEECVFDRSSTYHTGNADRTTSNDVLLQPHTHTHTEKS